MAFVKKQKREQKVEILPTTPPAEPINYSVFKKTPEEKILLKKAKRIYNVSMRSYYGDDWKLGSEFNVPIRMLEKK